MDKKKNNKWYEVYDVKIEEIYRDGELVGHVKKFKQQSRNRVINVTMEFNIPSEEGIRRMAEKMIEIGRKVNASNESKNGINEKAD